MSQSNHTPGPWAWFVNAKTKHAYLATTHSGRIVVMDFARAGLHRAQPRFLVPGPLDGYLSPIFDAHPCIVSPADHNGSVDVIHPNARLIAAAPDLLAVCEMVETALKTGQLFAGRHVIVLGIKAVRAIRDAIAAARGEGRNG